MLRSCYITASKQNGKFDDFKQDEQAQYKRHQEIGNKYIDLKKNKYGNTALYVFKIYK